MDGIGGRRGLIRREIGRSAADDGDGVAAGDELAGDLGDIGRRPADVWRVEVGDDQDSDADGGSLLAESRTGKLIPRCPRDDRGRLGTTGEALGMTRGGAG